MLGGGGGARGPTAALARAARTVHAVEMDRRLESALADAIAGAGDVRVHWGDAMKLDLGALDPPPTALVANLPYAIATPLVAESLWGLPRVERWCVMAQREVVDRWLAGPGSRLYGAPSVLIQLATEATFRRAVGREVFAPRPRVDSALVALRRTAPGPAPERCGRWCGCRLRGAPQDPGQRARGGRRGKAAVRRGARGARSSPGRPPRGPRAARVRRPGTGAAVSG